MVRVAGIEAQLAWALLFSGGEALLEEPRADYAGMLEGMEAAELLALVEAAQRRLQALKAESSGEAVQLNIDKSYRIRLGGPTGMEIPFRPLVRALFILFLRHPEGILLKERDRFRRELEEIYGVVAPNVSAEDRHRRIRRLTDLQDNAFSENVCVLNATLDRLLPPGKAAACRIQGQNGHPRKIPLSPLLVRWED